MSGSKENTRPLKGNEQFDTEPRAIRISSRGEGKPPGYFIFPAYRVRKEDCVVWGVSLEEAKRYMKLLK